MKRILILGAGLSASTLIKYLLDHSGENDWIIRLGDLDIETVNSKLGAHPRSEGFVFDISDEEQRKQEIASADLVISMLPARFHPLVAKACLETKTTMVTASYVSPEMKAMDKEAHEKGVLLINELGVDPGIDHMSAMKVIHEIKAKGGKLLSFSSNTGGLVAPEYDNNPWNYKFTWNPRNVVLAGQGTAKYLEKGQIKYTSYQNLFKRYYTAEVLDAGLFEVYANRDSLSYLETYGIEDVPSIFRGTMRRPGYCKAWDIFVQLGITDDSYLLEEPETLSYRQFINSFLPYHASKSVEEKFADFACIPIEGEIMDKMKWLGIFEETPVSMKQATPAQVLQKILVDKWVLGPEDKDMIVMQHTFVYELNGKTKKRTSSLVVKGTDTIHTAMSITVGTPVAIATKLILNGVIQETGVHVPVKPGIYEPILEELYHAGIQFVEEEKDL